MSNNYKNNHSKSHQFGYLSFIQQFFFFHDKISALLFDIQNGNPLQCSCPENPRDGGAWGAAIYGVTQSRTKRSLFLNRSVCQPITQLGVEHPTKYLQGDNHHQNHATEITPANKMSLLSTYKHLQSFYLLCLIFLYLTLKLS